MKGDFKNVLISVYNYIMVCYKPFLKCLLINAKNTISKVLPVCFVPADQSDHLEADLGYCTSTTTLAQRGHGLDSKTTAQPSCNYHKTATVICAA